MIHKNNKQISKKASVNNHLLLSSGQVHCLSHTQVLLHCIASMLLASSVRVGTMHWLVQQPHFLPKSNGRPMDKEQTNMSHTWL